MDYVAKMYDVFEYNSSRHLLHLASNFISVKGSTIKSAVRVTLLDEIAVLIIDSDGAAQLWRLSMQESTSLLDDSGGSYNLIPVNSAQQLIENGEITVVSSNGEKYVAIVYKNQDSSTARIYYLHPFTHSIQYFGQLTMPLVQR